MASFDKTNTDNQFARKDENLNFQIHYRAMSLVVLGYKMVKPIQCLVFINVE